KYSSFNSDWREEKFSRSFICGYAASKKLYLEPALRNKSLRFFTCKVEKHFVLSPFFASVIIASSLFAPAILFLNLKKSSSTATALQLLLLTAAFCVTTFSTESTGGISRNFFSS